MIQKIPGIQFSPQFSGGFSILKDDTTPSPTSITVTKTPGLTRVAPLQLQNQIPGNWRLVGWSLSLRVAIEKVWVNFGTSKSAGCWGQFGKLIAGVTVNAAGIVDLGPPIVPPDFTTFTEVWDPNEPCVVLNGAGSDETLYTPIGILFTLNSPIPISQADQIQFVLSMNRSVIVCDISSSLFSVGPTIRSANYTLLFDDGK